MSRESYRTATLCTICGEPHGDIIGRVSFGETLHKVCRPCVERRVADCRARQSTGDVSDVALLDGIEPRIGDHRTPPPMRWSSLADQLGIDRSGVLCTDVDRRLAERRAAELPPRPSGFDACDARSLAEQRAEAERSGDVETVELIDAEWLHRRATAR
jgi:hypothetical protein